MCVVLNESCLLVDNTTDYMMCPVHHHICMWAIQLLLTGVY